MSGPFGDARILFSPPENSIEGILIYQGKAYPHLSSENLVLTYSTNRQPFQRLTARPDLYYPRFVRVTVR